MSPGSDLDGNVDGYARLDFGRSGRTGQPEAVFCEGKTVTQVVAIVERFLANSQDAVIATRVTAEQSLAMISSLPPPSDHSDRTYTWNHRPASGSTVAVVAAGTSDLAVADECRLTLNALGHITLSITDVGVAGLHRLTAVLPDIATADLVVAVAGMEGALPTVLAGLISQPIIAVPTSVGYGAGLQGVTALLSMMASCAPGITVVGIDNGFGAAYAAHRMLSIGKPGS